MDTGRVLAEHITLWNHTLKLLIIIGRYFNRGYEYDNLGNYRQAIEDYAGRSKSNRVMQIPIITGVLSIKVSAITAGIEDYNRAIEIKPGYADAYNNRGVAYRGLSNSGRQLRITTGRSKSNRVMPDPIIKGVTIPTLVITSRRLRITTGRLKSNRVMQCLQQQRNYLLSQAITNEVAVMLKSM